MSPLVIGALVAGGVLILISIGFISHSLERARLERARQTAELSARVRYCSALGEELPGQFMTVELKSLLLTIEEHLLTQLLKLDRKNTKAENQLAMVRQQLSTGDLSIGNTPIAITSEIQARDVRLQLENLHKLLSQAHKDGLLDSAGLQQWIAGIRQHIVATTIEMFQALANDALQQGKPRVAKLQYERAVAYLQKQNDPACAEVLTQMRRKLNEAEQATIRTEQIADPSNSELLAGMDALEEDDEAWKKRSVYDD
ncbi:hypothetical protein [Pseudomonas saliphila]|uniref:hypothetical protein n=1 Tax=Pseudomonas saliphila TaxID=2586906 RepID=UPI00123BA163|nr:hypothetical protein [Pseudomonas saliphila]